MGEGMIRCSYWFGYNGMEKDPEVKGDGNSYTTEFRQYDPRLGRWLSLDPLMGKFPWMSPYVAFNNNPIFYTDPLGLEGDPPTKKGETFVGDDGVERVLSCDEFTVSATSRAKKVENAISKIDDFSKDPNVFTTFENIPKEQLVNDMKDLVNNPELTEQLPNTCGLSASQYYILKDNPEKYVDFLINVYSNKNEYVLSEDGCTKLPVDRDDFSDIPAEGNSASWIFQATVRNTYNEFFDYDPRAGKNDQIAGITTPSEVRALMKTFGYESVNYGMSNNAIITSRTILLIDWKGGVMNTIHWHYINALGSNDAIGLPNIMYFDTEGFGKTKVMTGMGSCPLPSVQGVLNFRYNE